jgi:hypothetical protein
MNRFSNPFPGEGFKLVYEPLTVEQQAALSYLTNIDTVCHECAENWRDGGEEEEGIVTAPDAHVWRLLSDGESIVSRHTKLSRKERAWLDKQAAVIVQVGSGEKPMYFEDMDEALAYWDAIVSSFRTELHIH